MGEVKCPLNFGSFREGILFCRPTGRMTSELADCILDCHEAHRELLGHPYDVLYDFRNLSGEDMSFDKIREIASRRIRSVSDNPPCKVCFLVSSPHAYGMARMYQTLIGHGNISVHISFDMKELAAILGVDELLLS
ncbi:MAG TPA: hypothetical protein PL033_14730 [Candidatus Brocadiia bacterium]|nr:hypothetical protein [Candidatus Brocadiia bacterium]